VSVYCIRKIIIRRKKRAYLSSHIWFRDCG